MIQKLKRYPAYQEQLIPYTNNINYLLFKSYKYTIFLGFFYFRQTFHIKPSKINQKTVEVVLDKLELNSGYLINSGKSYHFISKKLVYQNELEILLAKMIF